MGWSKNNVTSTHWEKTIILRKRMWRIYGLFFAKKTNGFVPGKPNIFGDDSDEDGQSAVSSSFKNKVKKQTQLEIDKALQDDPNVYEYDNIYDDIHAEKMKTDVRLKNQNDKKPKYIEGLLKSANQRKKDQEKRMERKIQIERQAEGQEFKDKEEFVTSAYKKKLLEMEEEEEREKKEAEMEALLDVTKQKDMSGFYRYLYHQQTADTEDAQEGKETEKSSSIVVKEEKASSEEREKITLEKDIKKIQPKREGKHYRKSEPTSSDDNSQDESKPQKRLRHRSSSSSAASSSSSSSDNSRKEKKHKQKTSASSKTIENQRVGLEDGRKHLSKNPKRYLSESDDDSDDEQAKKRKNAAPKSGFTENKGRSQKKQSRSRSRSHERHQPAYRKFRDKYSRSPSREDGRQNYRDNRYRPVKFEKRSRSRDRFSRRSRSRSRERNRFDRQDKRSRSIDRNRGNRFNKRSRSRSRDRVERYNRKSRSRSRDRAYNKYGRKSRSHSRDRTDKYSKNRSRSRERIDKNSRKSRSRSRDRIDKGSRKSRSRSRDRTDRYVKNRPEQKNSSSHIEIRDSHSEERQRSRAAKIREVKKSLELDEKREVIKLNDSPIEIIEIENGDSPVKDSPQLATSDAAIEKSEKKQPKDPLAKYAKRTVGDVFIDAQQRYFRRKMLQKPAIVVGDND